MATAQQLEAESTAVATGRAKNPAVVLRDKLSAIIPMMTEITGDKRYADRALQLLVLSANNNADIYKCTTESIAASVLRISQWNLDIGETAFVVPYNVNVAPKGETKRWEKRATPVPHYTGLMLLAKDAGSVREFYPPRIVYANDQFEHSYGTDEHLHHIPAPANKRGAMVGAYVVALMAFGVKTFVYLELSEIEAIRVKSKSWGPDQFKECPEWYAKKTVVRAFCNRLPKKGRKLTDALAQNEDEIPEGEMSEVARAQLADGEVSSIGAGADGPRALPSFTDGEYGG